MNDPSAEIKKVQEPLCLGLEWGPYQKQPHGIWGCSPLILRPLSAELKGLGRLPHGMENMVIISTDSLPLHKIKQVARCHHPLFISTKGIAVPRLGTCDNEGTPY